MAEENGSGRPKAVTDDQIRAGINDLKVKNRGRFPTVTGAMENIKGLFGASGAKDRVAEVIKALRATDQDVDRTDDQREPHRYMAYALDQMRAAAIAAHNAEVEEADALREALRGGMQIQIDRLTDQLAERDEEIEALQSELRDAQERIGREHEQSFIVERQATEKAEARFQDCRVKIAALETELEAAKRERNAAEKEAEAREKRVTELTDRLIKRDAASEKVGKDA